MRTTIISMLLVATAGAGVARADRDEALSNLMGPIGDAIRWDKPTKGWNGGADEILGMRANCREAIADAKKAGVRPNDVIHGWSGWDVNPKAKKLDKDHVDVKFADVGWYCDDLDKRTTHWDLVLRLADALVLKDKVAAGLTDDEKKNIMPEQVKDSTSWAKRCTDALAAEKATGAKSIDVDAKTVSLDDAGALCDVIVQRAAQQKAAWDDRVATVGPKYKAAGMNGERLELFVYYESVGDDWYLPGCKKSTSDPKVLAKQKVLFQWLGSEASGDIQVRKFAFKGDAYTITDTHYDTEAKAFAHCR
jgi:hypothetical protein